jgi:hypothetical protein
MISLSYGTFGILIEDDVFPGLVFPREAFTTRPPVGLDLFHVDLEKNFNLERFLSISEGADGLIFRDQSATTEVIWGEMALLIDWVKRRIVHTIFPDTILRPHEQANIFAVLVGALVSHFGGFTIHSAAIQNATAAYGFMGRSGAGKTSICRLLCPPCRIITDDFAVVVPAMQGTWNIHSLYSGLLGSPPLVRVFHLMKSLSAPSIQQVSLGRKLSLLYQSSYAPPRIPRFVDQHLGNMLKFLSQVECAILRFSGDIHHLPLLAQLVQEGTRELQAV